MDEEPLFLPNTWEKQVCFFLLLNLCDDIDGVTSFQYDLTDKTSDGQI